MRLAIARNEFAARINEHLRVVDDVSDAFGNAGYDRERKFLRHYLKRGNSSFAPRLRQITDDGHRITGIGCLGKNDQLRAFVFRARGEVAHLAQVRVDVTKRAGNLSSGYFHLDPRITRIYANDSRKSVNSRPFA